MKLRWLLTAAFEVFTENFKILLDPWITRPSNATPQLNTIISDIRDFDAIFLSHGHYDHCADIPKIVKNTDTKVYCSKQVGDLFLKDFGVSKKIYKKFFLLKLLNFNLILK